MCKTRWDFYLAVSQSLPDKFSSLHMLLKNLTHQRAKIMQKKHSLDALIIIGSSIDEQGKRSTKNNSGEIFLLCLRNFYNRESEHGSSK